MKGNNNLLANILDNIITCVIKVLIKGRVRLSEFKPPSPPMRQPTEGKEPAKDKFSYLHIISLIKMNNHCKLIETKLDQINNYQESLLIIQSFH